VGLMPSSQNNLLLIKVWRALRPQSDVTQVTISVTTYLMCEEAPCCSLNNFSLCIKDSLQARNIIVVNLDVRNDFRMHDSDEFMKVCDSAN
jgi:hypothetical protein